MIFNKVEVDGVEFSDFQRMTVNVNTSEYESVSSYQIVYDSPYGRHKSDFTVGQTMEIFADDVDGTTTLFKGSIERVKFFGKETLQQVVLSGRDFGSKLMDTTVEPIVFTNTEISTIVTSILGSAVPEMTTNNVAVTGINLKRISFNQTTVFEALTELAQIAGFFFYVDSSEDLHFEQRKAVSSGIILDNTNMKKSFFNTTREGMANSVFVYGDRYLAGFEETFLGDGEGSVFTLASKPRNTYITVSGAPQVGGVFEMTTIPTSGPNYLVSFNDRLLIFVSGTEVGYTSIPGSEVQVIAQYDRDLPIVKFGEDRTSISLYGRKRKIINDKSILDPNTASDILKSELKSSNPFKGVESDIQGWFNITPGQTARVTLSDFNINDEISILSVKYTFDKNSVQSEDVINIRLDRKIKDLTDEIKLMRKRLDAIESADRQETDTITRLEQSSDDFSIVGSYWEVGTRAITGSTFILSDSIIVYDYSTLASGTGQDGLTGSATGLGSPYGPLIVLASGGFY